MTKDVTRFSIIVIALTKYRYNVLQGVLRERVRDIIRQVCRELGVEIIKGVLSSNKIHMFVSAPLSVAISAPMQRVKDRSSHKIQMEFPVISKSCWGLHFWARGYFCTTSGNITRMTSYFSISRCISKNLPTQVGSGLVSAPLFTLWARHSGPQYSQRCDQFP